VFIHLQTEYWIYDIAYKGIGKPIYTLTSFNIDNPTLISMIHCGSKGFLSFLILWLVRHNAMTGAEIALELEKRRGSKPSPGTIYPVLKHLKEAKILTTDENKRYSLTEKGRGALDAHLESFVRTFYDIEEMKSCCCKENSETDN
jgi:PadR family transcriptional regulator PadR